MIIGMILADDQRRRWAAASRGGPDTRGRCRMKSAPPWLPLIGLGLALGLSPGCAPPTIEVQTPLTAAAARVDPADFAALTALATAARIPLEEVDVRFVARAWPAPLGAPLRSPAVAWVLAGQRRVVGLYLHGGSPTERCVLTFLCRLHRALGGREDPVFPGVGRVVQLAALRFLHLHAFSVGSLAGLGALGELRQLVVTSCELASLEGIQPLTGLRLLDVSDNRLRGVDPVAGLGGLVVLRAAGNRLQRLPELSALVRLRTLGLERNRLERVPDLSALVRLQTIDLAYNRLRQIDFASLGRIGALARATELRLPGNRLRDVRGIGALRALELLDLSDNRLESLRGIDELTRLKTLIVSGNQLRGLQASAPGLAALESINARGNRIVHFDELRLPPGLRFLDLDDNPIRAAAGLERLFLPLRRLQQIDLVGTPAAELDRAALKALKARHSRRIFLRICLMIEGGLKDC